MGRIWPGGRRLPTPALDLAINLIAPVNNFLHSLFSQVDMYLNDKMVSAATNMYSYRSYLETLLNYSSSAKDSQFSTSLWATDTAGHMDDLKFADNQGAAKRVKYANNCTESFEMLGGLHLDLCMQDKLLPKRVNLKIRMIRNKPSFYLKATTREKNEYNIMYEKVCLYVRKVVKNLVCLLA